MYIYLHWKVHKWRHTTFEQSVPGNLSGFLFDYLTLHKNHMNSHEKDYIIRISIIKFNHINGKNNLQIKLSQTPFTTESNPEPC